MCTWELIIPKKQKTPTAHEKNKPSLQPPTKEILSCFVPSAHLSLEVEKKQTKKLLIGDIGKHYPVMIKKHGASV